MDRSKLTHILMLAAGVLLALGSIIVQGIFADNAIAPGATVAILAAMLAAGWSRLSVVVSLEDRNTITKIVHIVCLAAGLLQPIMAKMATSVHPGTAATLCFSWGLLVMGDLRYAGIRKLPLLALLFIAWFWPAAARASSDDPVLGGCILWEKVQPPMCKMNEPGHPGCICMLSAHPTVIEPLSAIDLKEWTLSYGLAAIHPGVCYGVTYGPSKWYASGANFCLNLAHLDSIGNVVFPSGILQFVKWAEAGVGALCADQLSIPDPGAPKKLKCHAMLLFGVNIPVE